MRVSMLNSNISFGSGKVKVFTDFDGTYLPVEHAALHSTDENKIFSGYCKDMQSFLNKTKNNLSLNITSGRTFGEYESISWLLKLRGYFLPFPETFIGKNGSDKFIRTGSDADFYSQGTFPFDYNTTDIKKETDIKNATNWDGPKIQAKLKELCAKYQIQFVEADSENSVHDYGQRSLFSTGKLDIDEWKKLPKDENGHTSIHEIPITQKLIGLRKDGKLKINIIFPSDYDYCLKRREVYDAFMNEFEDYLKSEQIKYKATNKTADTTNFYRAVCSITPEIDGERLTKLYDTKEAVKEAIKNNDLVVVAGDGPNDFEMLNPLNYIDKDFENKCAQNSKFPDFYSSDSITKLKTFQKVLDGTKTSNIKALRKELVENGYLRALENLPLYSIIVQPQNSNLQQLIDTFDACGKVIKISTGELIHGIKVAVESQCEKSKTYKEAINADFRNYLSKCGKKIKDDKSNPMIKYLVIPFVISVLGVAIFKHINNSQKKTAQIPRNKS